MMKHEKYDSLARCDIKLEYFSKIFPFRVQAWILYGLDFNLNPGIIES